VPQFGGDVNQAGDLDAVHRALGDAGRPGKLAHRHPARARAAAAGGRVNRAVKAALVRYYLSTGVSEEKAKRLATRFSGQSGRGRRRPVHVDGRPGRMAPMDVFDGTKPVTPGEERLVHWDVVNVRWRQEQNERKELDELCAEVDRERFAKAWADAIAKKRNDSPASPASLAINVSRELRKAGQKGMKPTVVARYASLLEKYDPELLPKPPTAPPPARTPQRSGVIPFRPKQTSADDPKDNS
jgi:hypothetical protein